LPEVACLGDVNLDVLLYVDKLPKLGSESLASHLELRPGGAAANVAVALSRLGVPTGFIGAVGEDPFGRMLEENLNNEGVDTSLLQIVKDDHTGLAIIAVTRDGERTMLGYRGANRRLTLEAIVEEYFGSLRLLFISGYALLESPQKNATRKALDTARRLGSLIAIDISEPLAAMGLGEVNRLIGRVDYIFVNEREALLLAGALGGLGELTRRLARVVVVKRGGAGAQVFSNSGSFTAPAFKIEVVDTTGAGDAFDAGFIYGVLHGLKLEECLILANAVAAWKCTGRGSRHLPTLKELKRFLEEKNLGSLARNLPKPAKEF